jgi:glycosyltransferase involved in cell wall biosynthesis
MEAMSCGIPVIASEIGGTPDMIEHGVDGFIVKQRNFNGIADIVEELNGDVENRIRVGLAARVKAEKEFDAKLGARKLIQQIESTVQ